MMIKTSDSNRKRRAIKVKIKIERSRRGRTVLMEKHESYKKNVHKAIYTPGIYLCQYINIYIYISILKDLFYNRGKYYWTERGKVGSRVGYRPGERDIVGFYDGRQEERENMCWKALPRDGETRGRGPRTNIRYIVW